MRRVTRRRCSKPSCNQAAVSTLTYVYADSTAVVGPLATYAEPHCYDLCQMHSERLTAPKGWEIVRITPDPDALKPSSDDLEALANAVREAARPRYAADRDDEPARPSQHATVEVARRGHLRVLRSVEVADDPGHALDELPPGALGTYDDPFGANLGPRGEPVHEELVREPFLDDGLPFDDD